jgi:phage gp45-like
MRVSDLARALSPIRARLANMLARAVVSLVDDGTGIQTVQVSVLDGETRGDLERFQNFGFTSRPSAGAEAAVLFRRRAPRPRDRRGCGRSALPRDRTREGAACVYDAGGSKVTLHNDGSMDLEASSGATLTLTATGGVEVTPAAGQSIVLAGGVLAVARATDPIQGTAGPYPIAGVIAPTAGALQVKG